MNFDGEIVKPSEWIMERARQKARAEYQGEGDLVNFGVRSERRHASEEEHVRHRTGWFMSEAIIEYLEFLDKQIEKAIVSPKTATPCEDEHIKVHQDLLQLMETHMVRVPWCSNRIKNWWWTLRLGPRWITMKAYWKEAYDKMQQHVIDHERIIARDRP
ncbi:MAG TPA: hypothetical protein VD994_18035 [Prosthecobacter sp.]|nr:hypothetical protein [Prosthecobacter sp.]